MKFTEKRMILSANLRALCIKNNWYTCGNEDDYNELFGKIIKDTITTTDIAEIAQDIKEHSITEYEITSIMFEIARICTTFFEAKE